MEGKNLFWNWWCRNAGERKTMQQYGGSSKKSNFIFALVIMTLGKEILKVVCVYGLQIGRSFTKKHQFFDDLAGERNLCSNAEMVLGPGDNNSQIG